MVMAGKPKFVLKKNRKGEFIFSLKAANNEVIATSEAYASKQGAKNGIESIRVNAPVAELDDET
jgi:uncharacterized protein YegP (UPF0339 family)